MYEASPFTPSPPANPPSPGIPAARPCGRRAKFTIYDLHDRLADRHYVGVTSRSLAARCQAHVSQARRGCGIRPGGLMARLREILAAGGGFGEAFAATEIAHADSEAEARKLERDWIAALDAMSPRGYNLMPGGASLGGRSNSRPIVVNLGRRGTRRFGSIGEAIADRNNALAAEGKPPLQISTVHARLAAGRTAAQALGWRRHQDGRSRRKPFVLFGRRYTSMSAAARATGIHAETLKSRLHRLDRGSGQAGADITEDRRSRGPGSTSRLSIVWPSTSEVLTADAFARRAGVSKATVIHRWHRLRRERDAAGGPPLTAEEIHAGLAARVERRRTVTLELPDGTRLSGGEREVIRCLFGDPALGAGRVLPLSESGIRRRLRTLGEAERHAVGPVRWAFGFGPTP